MGIAVVMCLFLRGIYHSTFALTSSTQGEYPDDTIITAENLVDVLDSLGVSHGKVICTNSTKSLKFTVGVKGALVRINTITHDGAAYFYAKNEL